MNLVERGKQLSALETLFEECERGKGRIAIVDGPVGSGKSALLQSFTQRVIGSDAILLSAIASRAERASPLGVVSELFRGVELNAESADRVARLLDDAKLTAALGAGTPKPENDAALVTPVLNSVCTELIRLAQHQPLVISVDDVHYGDTASLYSLMHLAWRIESARILVVLNKSSQLRIAHAPIFAELSRLPHCRLIRIGPLSPAGVADVLAEWMDPQTAHALAPPYHAVSGGNPLLVQALCEDFAGSVPTVPEDVVTGDAFAQAVLNCLHRCEPALLTLASAVAVLDEDASPATLAQLTDLDSGSVGQALDALHAIGILDAHRFRHPRARAAVLGQLMPEQRRSLHARASRLLYEAGAASTAVARHLIEADAEGGPWVVPVLREAAEQALLADDLSLAVGALRLAHRTSADDGERGSIAVALACAEWRYRPDIAARRKPELVAAVRAGRMKEWDAVAAIGLLLWEGLPEEAMDALGWLDSDEAHPDTATAAGLHTARLWMSVVYPGVPGRAWRSWPAAGRNEPAPSDPQVRAAHGVVAVLCGEIDDDISADAEHMLQRSRLGSTPLGSIVTAIATLVYTGNPERAAHWCDLFRKEAAERRVTTWHAVLTAAHATIALRRGDLALAESSARDALSLVPPNGWGVAVGEPLSSLVLSAIERGKPDVASTYLAVPAPDTLFQTTFAVPYLRARGWYHLATDRYNAGLADFQTCGELMTRWDIDLPAFAPWRSDAAEAYLCLGDVRRAAELAADQLDLIPPQDRRTRGITLRVRALTRAGAERVALLETAVDELQISGDKHELARALVAFTRALREVNDHQRADETARQAYQLAGECSAEPLLAALAAADVAPAGFDDAIDGLLPIDGLSNAERRVATLAAQGHTNREIAARLHITVSTVEQHLTRVYRKLNVDSRNDLPSDLQRVTPD